MYNVRMETSSTMKRRLCVAVTLCLCLHGIIETSASSLPCSRLLGNNNNTTTEPCIPEATPSPVTPYIDQSEAFLNSPYVFIVLCTLVFVPFLILIKVWWVKRLQKAQYIQRRPHGHVDDTEIYVIDSALFAPPPSYEECMVKSPSYDCLPAYEDLKFGPEGKPYIQSEDPGTSTGTALPQ